MVDPRVSADPALFLRDLFAVAVRAVSPRTRLADALPEPPRGRTVVVGAGKGAAAMAAALEAAWPAHARARLSGLVVTRYGHGEHCDAIEVVEAAHPVPDEAGRAAAARILQAVQGLGADDLVVCLVSGGGSALLTQPIDGLSLADKQAINRALLRSGADIFEMNCVRRHLSAIKGGRLALACAPARVHTILVSDIPGDDPAVIASGPTMPDLTTCAQALAILRRYAIPIPDLVAERLGSGAWETPKPADFAGLRATHAVIARAEDALQAAAMRARESGLRAYVLTDRLEGEAREVGRVLAALALRTQADAASTSASTAFEAPCVLLSGGETTVTVRGNGRGGRNAEFLLGLALALQEQAGIWAIAADTDGIDGSEDNAGAVLAPTSLARARAAGLDPLALAADNDAYTFFDRLGDLVVTGPTRTNVNDFRAILVMPAAGR